MIEKFFNYLDVFKMKIETGYIMFRIIINHTIIIPIYEEYRIDDSMKKLLYQRCINKAIEDKYINYDKAVIIFPAKINNQEMRVEIKEFAIEEIDTVIALKGLIKKND